MVFDPILSNIDEVLLINPFVNVFVFGDFNFDHKDQLTYSGRTDGSGELRCLNDLTQMFNCPTQIPDCDFLSLALFDLFLSSKASIYFTVAFPPLGNSDHVVVSVSVNFSHIHNGMPHFLALFMTILIGTVFVII